MRACIETRLRRLPDCPHRHKNPNSDGNHIKESEPATEKSKFGYEWQEEPQTGQIAENNAKPGYDGQSCTTLAPRREENKFPDSVAHATGDYETEKPGERHDRPQDGPSKAEGESQS